MELAVIGLALIVFILVINIIKLYCNVDNLKFDSAENERRLNHQLKMLHDNKNKAFDLQQRLHKSEEKRKKMGDAFFHDLNVLKERHEILVNLIYKIHKLDIEQSCCNAKEIVDLHKSIETTDEMLLELATKVEYLENK